MARRIFSAQQRLENERRHFNRIVREQETADLVMELSNLERYRSPVATTPFPLEYAFHLAGNLRGRSVIEIGCGDGLNTVKLAALGGIVTAVDISDESLKLSERRARANGVQAKVRFMLADAANLFELEDSCADIVFAISVLHHVDVTAASREIRRVLKPGGRAVLMEPAAGPRVWRLIKKALPRSAEVSKDEAPLLPQQIRFITETVGRPGSSRYFGLTYRFVKRLHCSDWAVVRRSHIVDAWLLERIKSLSAVASPLVWCVDKPMQ